MNLQTQVLEAAVEFSPRPFVKPLQISSGIITQITEASVSVRVLVAGREATGRGSIYLSDLWAWPTSALTHEQRDAALRKYSLRLADQLPALCGDEPESPLELGLRLHHSLHSNDAEYSGHHIPMLARAMCASPFDAALHDAVGVALECSAFDFYENDYAVASADRYFDRPGACAAIRHCIEAPRSSLDAWLIVGANDDLGRDVAPWIQTRGYRCFKLKIQGQDAQSDAARTSEVFRFAKNCGVIAPRLCADSNEGNVDATSVLDYLECLRAIDTEAFDALEYLEQPTDRDIMAAAFDWREVAQRKTILLDEGLSSIELLPLAREQGWSGLALKTCKGHSFVLVAAAWARANGLLLSMQDLTNPGYAAIHAALLASRLPTNNGVELNSPQYTPEANQDWLPRLNGLFEVRDGVHRVPESIAYGLGSSL